MTASVFDYAAAIDVTAEICPMTYVRTRLALDRLLAGQHLRVTLRGAETLRNVTDAACMQGHLLVDRTLLGDDIWDVVIRKKEGSASF